MGQWLVAHGHDVIHTLDLPARNATPDRAVVAAADQADRVVVTKDSDFAESQARSGRPRRLLHVTTGNISNRDLGDLVAAQVGAVVAAFELGAVSVRLTAQGVEVVRFDDR